MRSVKFSVFSVQYGKLSIIEAAGVRSVERHCQWLTARVGCQLKKKVAAWQYGTRDRGRPRPKPQRKLDCSVMYQFGTDIEASLFGDRNDRHSVPKKLTKDDNPWPNLTTDGDQQSR